MQPETSCRCFISTWSKFQKIRTRVHIALVMRISKVHVYKSFIFSSKTLLQSTSYVAYYYFVSNAMVRASNRQSSLKFRWWFCTFCWNIFLNAASCTELKAEWRSTIATTTTFPVTEGTVVEVKCSDTGALNTGSNIVICITQTQFTYVKEPSCSTPGKLNELYQILINWLW